MKRALQSSASPLPEQAQNQPPPPFLTPGKNASLLDAPLAPESVHRILVCQLRQIGDVLLATPALELLARQYPQAQLHVFVEEKCAPMLRNNPHVHTLWTVNKKKLPTLLHELAYYRKVTSSGFDLVVDFQQLPRCRWVVALSRAKVRLSFPPPWFLRWLYTHWSRPTPTYAAAYKANVLAPLGISWNGERPRLYLTDEERAAGRSLLAEFSLAKKDFLVVDATHRHRTRRWPAYHFAALLDLLAKAFPNLHFLLPYGLGEEKDVRALVALLSQQKRAVVPPSVVALRHMAACMEHASFHLGTCSSPRHMAVAVGLPTFTILGSTSSGWCFPAPEHTFVLAGEFMHMPCQHCNKNTCSENFACLEKLTPAMVFPRVREHLTRFGRFKNPIYP